MARKKPADPTKDAIEVQCRRLRDLAVEMKDYGESRRGGKLFVSWAATVISCAEELERAVADGDTRLRDRLLNFAAENGRLVVSTVVATTITLGVTGVLTADAPSDAEKLLECANRVVEQAETIEEFRRTSELTASGSGGGDASQKAAQGTPFEDDEDLLTTEDGDALTTEAGDPIRLEGPSPTTATEEALQTYGRGFEDNLSRLKDQAEEGRESPATDVERILRGGTRHGWDLDAELVADYAGLELSDLIRLEHGGDNSAALPYARALRRALHEQAEMAGSSGPAELHEEIRSLDRYISGIAADSS